MFHAAVVVQCSALAEGVDLVELCPPLPCGLMVRCLTHNIPSSRRKSPVTAVPVCFNLRAAACNSACCVVCAPCRLLGQAHIEKTAHRNQQLNAHGLLMSAEGCPPPQVAQDTCMYDLVLCLVLVFSVWLHALPWPCSWQGGWLSRRRHRRIAQARR